MLTLFSKPKEIIIDLLFPLSAYFTKDINNLLALVDLLLDNDNIKLIFTDNILLVKNNKSIFFHL